MTGKHAGPGSAAVRPVTRLIAGALFPLQERLKGHPVGPVRRWLERTQWWSPEALAELRQQRLTQVLERAHARVPFYRERFAEAGIHRTDLADGDILERIPLLPDLLVWRCLKSICYQLVGHVGR